MNCGPSLSTPPKSRAESLRSCDDCDRRPCRWNRIGHLRHAVIEATEKLPPGYRVVIDIQRDDGVVELITPSGRTRVIEGEGYISEDIKDALKLAQLGAI